MQPILKVNLTQQTFETMLPPRAWEVDFLGGASLAARLLYDHLKPEIDPLSPDAPLLFMNGPLSGTAGPAVGRFVVCARSPATGLWGESNCGGFWGPELRKAGFDGLWIEGRASSPVYLSIHDAQVEIRPAGHLWGMDTYTAQAAVRAELSPGNPRVASIGPAGEAQIPFALILTDHGRVAGRTGMGAVMGAKNLKAVAVEGSGKVPLVDLAAYTPLRSEANRMLRADAATTVLRDLGTGGVADYFDYLAEMPKKYFHAGLFDDAAKISGSTIAETILAGVSACHACVIACGRVVRLEDGEKRKGPEYETLIGFGPNLLLGDAVFATRMGELCDRYGMDSISLSNTIGLAFRLFEIGRISETDTGGMRLEWGNTAAIEALVHQTLHGDGLGLWIAKGARQLARHFGAEEEAVQVNGLEVAYHDPRGASGMALVYATSPRGACHNQSDYFLADIGQVETSIGLESLPRQAGAEKAANVARHQDWRSVFNALVICLFANIPPETLLALINTACGLNWSLEDMMRCGERGWTLKRAINNRLGLRRANDRLPEALLQPYSDDPPGAAGFVPDFEAMLAAYYAARGWDAQTGYPSAEKLLALGLDWVAEELWPNT
jgi:aldehyde:ferredoxin oxidoreductase